MTAGETGDKPGQGKAFSPQGTQRVIKTLTHAPLPWRDRGL
jgi:hypothetical protein